MLKKSYFLLMLLLILFILPGCDEFFTFNLFEGMDPVFLPTAETLAEKTPTDGIAYLKDNLESDSFMEELANDPVAEQAVEAYLEGIYTDTTVETELRVSAAVLAADMNLGVSGGEEVVNGIFNAIQELQTLNSGENTGTDSEAIAAILTGIIPESILDNSDPVAQEAAFVEVMAGLLAAGDIYQTLGDSIITDPAADNASGDITGGVVFNAAICGILNSVVTDLLLPSYQEPEAAATVLWNIYTIATTGGDITTIEGLNPSAELNTSIEDMTFLQNIAAAAGADLATLFGSSGATQ